MEESAQVGEHHLGVRLVEGVVAHGQHGEDALCRRDRVTTGGRGSPRPHVARALPPAAVTPPEQTAVHKTCASPGRLLVVLRLTGQAGEPSRPGLALQEFLDTWRMKSRAIVARRSDSLAKIS